MKIKQSVKVTIPFNMYDWTELLTFDEICETLSTVGMVKGHGGTVSEEDSKAVEEWLSRNDIMKFVQARDLALQSQQKLLEAQMFAQEISNMPLKIARSH